MVGSCHENLDPGDGGVCRHHCFCTPEPQTTFRDASGLNSRRSFDHLVGAGEQRERESDAEPLGSLEINDQLDLRDSLTQRQLQLLEPR